MHPFVGIFDLLRGRNLLSYRLLSDSVRENYMKGASLYFILN